MLKWQHVKRNLGYRMEWWVPVVNKREKVMTKTVVHPVSLSILTSPTGSSWPKHGCLLGSLHIKQRICSIYSDKKLFKKKYHPQRPWRFLYMKILPPQSKYSGQKIASQVPHCTKHIRQHYRCWLAWSLALSSHATSLSCCLQPVLDYSRGAGAWPFM